MGYAWTNRVWEESPFTGATKLIHLALADWADDDGVCYPSQETIAKKVGCSVEWVRLTMRRLVDEGYLEILSEAKRGASRRYRLKMAPTNLAPTDLGSISNDPNSDGNGPNSDGLMAPTPSSGEPSVEPSVRTKDFPADASSVTNISNQHAKVVADAIYEHTNELGKYQAIRQVAAKAVKRFTPEQVIRAMKQAHDDGRPLTGAVVDQYLTGKTKARQAQPAQVTALGFNGSGPAPWDTPKPQEGPGSPGTSGGISDTREPFRALSVAPEGNQGDSGGESPW